MKKPSLEDFRLKSFKMINSGGAEVEFNFRYSEGNEAHEDSFKKIKRTLSVHKDLFDILLKQATNVLKVEGINYRLMVSTAQQKGINDDETIKLFSQIAEGMTNEARSKIQPTGFSISGNDEKRQVVITYQKLFEDKKILGRSTPLILLSNQVYGFEEELESDIEDFNKEVYNYIYKNKHSDSEQLQFDLFAENEEIEEDLEEQD